MADRKIMFWTLMASGGWHWGPDLERLFGYLSVVVVGGYAIWMAIVWAWQQLKD